jgi:hypothetical protein
MPPPASLVGLAQALNRLAKAVGLRHLDGPPPRAPFWAGLHRIGDQAERDVARALREAWTALAREVRDWRLETVGSRSALAALMPRLTALVRTRLQAAAEASLLRAQQEAARYLTGTDPPDAVAPEAVAKILTPTDAVRHILRGVDWFLLNPRMIARARAQATRLTDVETDVVVQAIRQALETSLTAGLPADETAQLIESSVGLNARQAQALHRYAETLRAQGRPSEAVERALQRYADRARQARAELIARTEGQAAANGGAYDAVTTAMEQGLIPDLVKEWIASNGACPICRTLDRQQQPIATPFMVVWPRGRGRVTFVDHPPAHPACRCKFGLAEPRG